MYDSDRTKILGNSPTHDVSLRALSALDSSAMR